MKILVVDDDPDTRRLLSDLLKGAGHSVTLAVDGAQGLIHVRIRNYDLVLIDLMMPGIDGFHLAQMLSTSWKTFDVPFVIVSCLSDEQSKSWARLNGCAGYVEKPFQPWKYLDKSSEILYPHNFASVDFSHFSFD